MSLFLDENLSPKLCRLLTSDYPGVESVLRVGLSGAQDAAIWDYATVNGLAIVSKDSDFIERAIMSKSPCKVVHVRLGNCTTEAVAIALQRMRPRVAEFLASDDVILEVDS